jgi:hypothetical protein
MKKLSIVGLAFVLFITFGFDSAFAASAKATAKCGDISVVQLGEGYAPIFAQTIRTPNGGDLFIDVSLECGMMTNLKAMTRRIKRALTRAQGTVMVQVLVDGIEANPGEIIFARRDHNMITKFSGDISECITIEPVIPEEPEEPPAEPPEEEPIQEYIASINEECIQPATLELILATMTANSFNFIASDLSSGEHTIVVLAKVTYIKKTEVDAGSAAKGAISAYLGNGSVTIEAVKMIKDEDVVME